jgi:hypothetical protein
MVRLLDTKFLCFKGAAKYLRVVTDRPGVAAATLAVVNACPDGILSTVKG